MPCGVGASAVQAGMDEPYAPAAGRLAMAGVDPLAWAR